MQFTGAASQVNDDFILKKYLAYYIPNDLNGTHIPCLNLIGKTLVVCHKVFFVFSEVIQGDAAVFRVEEFIYHPEFRAL